MRSHFLNKSPAKIPHKTIICTTLQALIGTTLILTSCLLLAGYIRHVGASRAIVVLIVGILTDNFTMWQLGKAEINFVILIYFNIILFNILF